MEKLAVNLSNKLAIFAEGAKNVDDKAMASLFKVSRLPISVLDSEVRANKC